MSHLTYQNRETKQLEVEKIPGQSALEFLYAKNPFSIFCCNLLCKTPAFSRLFGKLKSLPTSKKLIKPFIHEYNINTTEFLDPVDSFESFNDFFIRRLKPDARPIANGNDVAILPADGRYKVYTKIEREKALQVKGKDFDLKALLKSERLAHKYAQGALAIARLAPIDYHRFHFPISGTPSEAKLINGPLYSVNPIALKENLQILWENKRMITELKTQDFGTVLIVEVGATYVGSIHQTYTPQKQYAKGDEKGYFAFGGSCIMLIFEPFRIQFDQDLIDATHRGLETRAKYGQTLGRANLAL